jgi:alkylation response protein AidB-like acyl-CoA dehydrogenase
MDLTYTKEDQLFRAEAREWLSVNAPRDPAPPEHDSVAYRAHALAWQRKQYDGGWAGVAWPKEYGGRGLSAIHQLIWQEEIYRANPYAGDAHDLLFVTISHAAPTIIQRGSEEQKAFHLPQMLRGDVVWCQGFSEPNNGSDLAGLRCRAVVDGDDLVVNGTKIWTSNAHIADWQELLVRTDPEAPRHKGISWVICDMRSPGIELRPINIMTGPHHHHFNQVFYNDVRIPLSNVVGGLNNGWNVAMTTLGFERSTAGISRQLVLSVAVERLIAMAERRFGRQIFDHDEMGARLAFLRAEVTAVRAMALMAISRSASQAPGSESSLARAYTAELHQRVMRTAIEIIGPDAMEYHDEDPWLHQYLRSYSNTLAAGTSEIQRNIIGERVLGLPR